MIAHIGSPLRLLMPMQPLLVLSALAVLPAGLQVLELDAPCAGPVLEALKRFRSLQELRITGNGAGITWESRGTAGVLSKLLELRLDGRQREEYNEDAGCNEVGEVHAVHGSIASMLAPATRLRSLALRISWDDAAAALCSALPALEHLR